MKLYTTLIIGLLISLNATAKGQTISLSLKNSPLKNVFLEIQKQSDYKFAYRNETLKNSKNIDINVSNASIAEVLQMCLKNLPLSYTIIDKIIVIGPQKNTITPPITVKGRVINEKGEPVASVTVTIKGTETATLTNLDGEFYLSSVENDAVLIFSSVNMEKFELKVNGTKYLTVSLKTKITSLSDVTVSINTGYQEIPQERSTGSFEKINNKLINRSVSINILQRIDGIVPGLIFNRSISSSNPNDISIRGISTLNSDQRPLIIIDNFPYEGDITNINPNDVESISILKDASAASIWGARAGNGVIVITTKKGKFNQKINVSINSNITIAEKPDLFFTPLFPSNEIINIEKSAFSQGMYDPIFDFLQFLPVSPVIDILHKRKTDLITAEDSAKQLDYLGTLDVRNDYLKYLYRREINQQNSISISGGNPNINYLFSAGFDKNLFQQVGNERKRISLNSQVTIKPISFLEIQMGSLYTQNNYKNNSVGASLNWLAGEIYPYAQFINNGTHLSIVKDLGIGFLDTSGVGNLLDWKYRPLDEQAFADNTSKAQDLLLNIGLRASITSNLSFDIKYQYENQLIDTRNYYSPETYYTRNLINQFTPYGESAISNSAIPYGGILDITNSRLNSDAFRAQINFSKTWNKHDLYAIAGNEIRQSHIITNGNRTYGFDDESLSYKNVDYINAYPTYLDIYGSMNIPNLVNLSDATNRFVSQYANAAYTFDKKYTISASARRDASNLFGIKTNNKWKPLWSIGCSWNISNESFYNLSFIPQLKVRSTYGFSGNVNNSIPAILTISALPTPNSLTNLPRYSVNNPPNPSLKWENVRMFNIGVDFSTKKSTLYGSIEFYTKKSTDLIAPSPADITTGYTSLTVNAANLKGSGVDININSKNINKLIRWQTNYIFSYNTNKVSKYLFKRSTAGSYINSGSVLNPLEGKNAYEIISWKWGGLDPNTGDPQGFIDGVTSKDYSSITNKATFNDIVFNGSARPQYFGGIRNTFSYKQVSLSMNITFRLGYYFNRPNSINYSSLVNFYSRNGYTDYLNRWQKPGDESHTNVPSFTWPLDANRDNFYSQSEINVEKGDHIRFQDINLSYSIDKQTINKFPFKQITIYTYINNIGLIWKANSQGLDPDYGTPPSRSIAIGIKADL